jgi:hypothetical protein
MKKKNREREKDRKFIPKKNYCSSRGFLMG